ncbi:hypothetical protein D3C76_1684610 [compost metagenome]
MRVERRNSLAFSSVSRRAMLLEMAEGVVPALRAAALNEPASTARTKAIRLADWFNRLDIL